MFKFIYRRILWPIFHPSYYVMVGEYSPEWEETLIKLALKNKFEHVPDRYIAFLGKHKVWIANHPYGSFTPWPGLDIRPSRYVIAQLRKKLIKDIYDSN